MRESPSPVIDEPWPARGLGWILAVLGPAAAAGLGLLLGPLLEPDVLPPFLLAIATAALVGGVGPGLLAVLLSTVVCNYWFFPARFGFASQATLVGQLVFWASSLLVAALCAWSRARRLRAESSLGARPAEGQAARGEVAPEDASQRLARPERTALVADADAKSRQLACHALESVGFRWLSACDGTEALELLDRYDFSIEFAIVEVVLPDMSGRALADRLSARHPGVAVLYTSTAPSEELVRQGLLRVGEPLIGKPLTAEELVRAVRVTREGGSQAESGDALAISGEAPAKSGGPGGGVQIEHEYDREERRARAGVSAGVGLAVVAVAVALLLRYRPDVASALLPLSGEVASTAREDESGVLARSAGAATPPAPPDVRGRVDSAPDSSRATPDSALPATLALLQDTTSRAPTPAGRTTVTDVLLLPCSTPNPRPDGNILIPPHNPRHRTIVGLPQKPGEPPYGFVVPPHDPKQESQVPIQIIPMDSILAHTLRVPPHDPRSYTVVRADTLACLPDSE